MCQKRVEFVLIAIESIDVYHVIPLYITARWSTGAQSMQCAFPPMVYCGKMDRVFFLCENYEVAILTSRQVGYIYNGQFIEPYVLCDGVLPLKTWSKPLPEVMNAVQQTL